MKQHIVTAKEMADLDRHTIENLRVPAVVLMENAGFTCARELLKDFPGRESFAVVCGPGNNGGDGYVIARHLLLKGRNVNVFTTGVPKTSDARIHYETCVRSGVPISPLEDLDPSLFQVGIDALFGTGLARELNPKFKTYIRNLNRIPRVFAVDIPSGICSDTGAILGEAVKAYKTFTFQLPKRGHFLMPGCVNRGLLDVVDIGICTRNLSSDTPFVETTLQFELPTRAEHAHKNHFGHLLCVGGAPGMSGAIFLAGRAALEVGAGLVTIGSNSTTLKSCQQLDPTLMGLELKSSKGFFEFGCLDQILSFKKDVVLLGPGGGSAAESRILFRELILKANSPMIVDADALRSFKNPEDAVECLRTRSAGTILTPHPGEFAQLTGFSTAEIEPQKLELCSDFAQRTGVILVLKGAGTVVALPSGRTHMYYYPNPILAKAGSGDVLAGIIAALLCQGFDIEEAASNGVKLHAASAKLLVEESTPYSGHPLKLIENLPKAIRNYQV